MRHVAIITALAGLLAAPASCDRNSAAEPSCSRRQLAELKRWCDNLVAEGTAFNADVHSTGLSQTPTSLVRVSRAATGRPAWSSPVAVVNERGILVSRRFYPHKGAGSSQVLREALMASQSSPPTASRAWNPDDLQLAIAPEIPWRTVVSLSRAAKSAGFDSLTFLFEGRSLVAPPRSALLPTSSATVANSSSATAPEDRCVAAVRQLLSPDAAATASTSSSEVALCDGIIGALKSCRCRGSLADVKAMVWLHAGRADGVPTYTATLRLAFPGTAAPRLRLGPQLSWSRAHGPVLLAAGNQTPQVLDATR